MGSKNNPSKFNCYDRAEPDEPMFVLLGRDPLAPLLIELWAKIRHAMGEDVEKVLEAKSCANDCAHWLLTHEKRPLNDKLEVVRVLLKAARDIADNADVDDEASDLLTDVIQGAYKMALYLEKKNSSGDLATGTILSDRAAQMIKGLVRYAELREQDEEKFRRLGTPAGEVIWDDESREALKLAREHGWCKDRTGRLP